MSWASRIVKTVMDRTAMLTITRLHSVSKMAPAYWVFLDTLFQVRYFRMFSYRDHMMRLARFGMGVGYFTIMPHQSLNMFLNLNPWF
jgi:hypothetical protein